MPRADGMLRSLPLFRTDLVVSGVADADGAKVDGSGVVGERVDARH
jgi:hypothetical protein